MTAPPICPHCGYDLECDAPIARGRFAYDRTDGLRLDGVKLPLSPQCLEIVAAIFRLNGELIKPYVLAERCGTDAQDPSWIYVQLHRIRAVFAAAGVDCPIESVRGRGYRWSAS